MIARRTAAFRSLRTVLPGLVVGGALALGLGCGGTEELSLWPALDAGAVVPGSGVTELTRLETVDGGRSGAWIPRGVEAVEGWGRADFGWRPVGPLAVLAMAPPGRAQMALHLGFRDRRESGGAPVEVQVVLDGVELGRLTLDGGPVVEGFPLPGPPPEAPATLELRFDPPLAEGGRQLIGLAAVGWERAGAARVAVPRRQRRAAKRRDRDAPTDRPGRPAAPLEAEPSGDDERTLALAGGSSAVAWLPAMEDGRKLALEVRFTGPREPADALIVAIDDPVAGRAEVGRLQARQAGGEWKGLGVDGSTWPDRELLLVLHASAAAGGVEIRDPTLGGRPAPVAPRATPIARPSELPDVLLIVLDAARGDRFGGSYYRETHPRIDEMFADGLTFRSAFSECPTTACSMPNMVTGVAFLRGGDTFRARRIAPELTTLAESLHGAGYRTACFSANPNDSRSRGFDQGCDVFRELWGANPHHGPFGLSELAVEEIEARPAGEPLFLQMHYLPPHQPYEPTPEYDVYRDRGYEGPVHPRMSFQAYAFGRHLLAGEDLRQLVDLYDGNLRMVDAAVGGVFDALRRTGRWENTLVVLTADHGEAFMEHNRLGHNTTLYDEMLHVPLLVRLPGGDQPLHDPDRLAAVADIVPTILGRLGLSGAPELSGIDLLATPVDPRHPRLLFARTSHPQQPWLAVRSPRWKLMVWPSHQIQRLFDLEADPAERRNLLLERPALFAGLGVRLRDHVAATADRFVGGSVELSEDEKRALRDLGYVD